MSALQRIRRDIDSGIIKVDTGNAGDPPKIVILVPKCLKYGAIARAVRGRQLDEMRLASACMRQDVSPFDYCGFSIVQPVFGDEEIKCLLDTLDCY